MVKNKIKKLVAIGTVFFSLVSFSPNLSLVAYADTIQESQVDESTRLTYEEEQGSILHAWDWSFNNIANNIEAISKAGYKSIQVSPIQGNIDINGEITSNEKWWVLYQPINFKIGNKQLGTEEEFKKMCEVAHSKGIDIIVDIIVNHTGNNGSNADTPSENVDQEIKDLGSDAWHSLKPVESWNSRYCVTQEDIGLPDLNTENHKIQDMAKEYLQQCLKSGADGFRFDTAKHVGLPTESDDNGKVVKSDFWPNVLEGLKTNDGNTPYIYGEVLQGGADNFKEYSKYINLTSSNYGGSVRSAVGLNGNPDVSKIEDYNSEGVSPKRLISWVESHDTYANDSEESTALTDEQIRNGWALIASRAYANPLFFNRPAGRGKLDGSIGDCGDDNWRNPDVVAVNKFRNAMLNQDEKLVEINKEIMMIERGTSNDSKAKGVVIVNLGEDYTVSGLDVNLENGTYDNCGVNDSSFTVNEGKISGVIKKGITVLYKDGQKEENVQSPVVSVDKENQSFQDKLDLILKVENSTNATYSVNDGAKVPYVDEMKVTIGSDITPGESVKLTLEATNADGTRTAKETYTYVKKAVGSTATVYFEKPDDWDTPLYVYAKNEVNEQNKAWPGEKMTKIGDKLYKYELKDWTNSNVIINDSYAGKHQTSSLNLKYDGMMKYSKDGNWTETQPIAEDPNVTPDIEKQGTSKVYIQIPESWKDESGKYYDDVYVYMYGVQELAKWPGVPMEKVEGKEGLYTYTLPAGLEGSMVLFNAKGGTVQVPKDTGFKAPKDSTMIYDGEWKEYLNGTSKAYFRKPADWKEPNIYVWKDDSSEVAKWPGISMTKVEGTETLYSYTLPENYGDANIIFNDGSNKTDDLKLPSEKAMIYDNGEFRDYTTDDLEEPEVQNDKEGITKVYFKNTSGWEKVKVYAYNDGTSEKVKDWPGESAKDEGNDLYSYSLPKGFESATVIFNNGSGGTGNQTGNLQTKTGNTMIYDEESDSLKSMSKVYFKNTYGWDKVRVHYWVDGGSSTTWPGESPVYYGDDLYGLTLPEGFENANVIFNNNNKGEQTKTVKVTDGETKIFIGNDETPEGGLVGEWRDFAKSDIPSGTDTDKPDEGNDDDVSDKLTKAYFENKDGWENLRVYFYTEKSDGSMNKEFSKWPGVELTSEGNDLYSYTFPKGYKNSTLIFNGTVTTSAAVSVDGTETTEKSVQTENLKIKAGELMIYSNGTWDKYTGENPDKDDDTSKVKKVSINGTFKVGNTLKTQIFNEDGKEITPEVSYQWYRASSQSGQFEKIDGAVNSQYKLTSSDKSKYIKVLVTDKDGNEVYSQATSRISSSSSSHHSHNSSNSVSNDTSSNNDSVTENKVTNNNIPEKTESKLDKEGWNLNSDGTWTFVEKGNKVTGWKQVNNLWYFMNDNGVMNTGWKQINNTWYYMNNSGSMMTGWQFINNKWYYLNESGDMATGWKDVNGIWYYLYSDGSMAYNTIIDGYNLDVSGAWI